MIHPYGRQTQGQRAAVEPLNRRKAVSFPGPQVLWASPRVLAKPGRASGVNCGTGRTRDRRRLTGRLTPARLTRLMMVLSSSSGLRETPALSLTQAERVASWTEAVRCKQTDGEVNALSDNLVHLQIL